MRQREKMSPVDTAWLRMDRATNLMMIVGVIVFDRRTDFERLRDTIEARLVGRYRRFRQCAVEEVAGTWWQDDPDFDLDAHLRRRALPGKAGKRELQQLASELAVQPLNSGKPLWCFDLIEEYQGGSAMVVRIHHAIADGIALVGVILSLTDISPHAEPQQRSAPQEPTDESDEEPVGLLETLAETLGSALSMGSELGGKALHLASDPDRLSTYGRHGIGLLTELAKLLAMPGDSPTSLKGKTSTVKRVAWSDLIPLGEVKALGKALSCSVNDILMAAVAGALRAYFQQKGEAVHDVEVRAMIPVNLRSARHEGTLGNRFGLGTLSLPVHEGNPFARLFLVRQRMNELKGSYQPPLTLALLGAVGIAPKMLQQQFLDILAAKASTVMTNVPGPRQPLYLAGSRLDELMFWVPQSGNIGIGVSILSYNDNVQFGLITDRNFVPDPETITPLFAAEFEKMMLALLMLEWEQPFDPALVEQQLFGKQLPPPLSAAAPKPKARSTKTGNGAKPVRKAAAKKAPAAPAPIETPQRVPKRFRNLV
ncbi:MAG: wax ester/triacylglycerol synthase family O-acyltransferase [Sulfuritalea sp.]|nr:wax ester/triacylglycerol synthase family O-acyltransferase [Sulfuritalea sp.]MDP1983462.1 wax ester/triacylglycerol synthase family O-acyltransferase [Sulfuritalea sp.]